MLVIRHILFCLIISSLSIGLTQAGSSASTEALHSALATLDSNTEKVYLIGYQSIDQPIADEYGATRYIILDFRADRNQMQQEELVSKVGDICGQIISNRPLIHNLSALGYDMISVAFDEKSQFDCL